MITGRYSLSQLLDNDSIEQIIIPEMQRDYVWTPLNVERLLRSIGHNFEMKRSEKLNITCGGKVIDEEWHEFLTKEYERLRYNSRIGFIYAYYDMSDTRCLYLIDGQQRITTFFLILLAIYSRSEASEEFRERYMKQGRPRLDYKVREDAHRFLSDFIEFILDNPDGDFKKDSNHYYSPYDNDPTVVSILSNFQIIRSWVGEMDVVELCDYIENFIEFNYFDTGLSRQGERLYLYMNSRGENLSLQEQVRPKIILRNVTDKLKAGLEWERWQNFFWQHREHGSNADPGFLGFLKITVILHQAVYKSGKTAKEREDYIRDKSSEQEELILRYIIDTDSFDFAWMQRVFEAVCRLEELKGPYPCLRAKEWLSKSSIVAEKYISICGTLLLAVLFPETSTDNLYRMAMYLLSRTDDSANRQVGAVIRAMNLVLRMKEQDVLDVLDLNKVKDMPAGMDITNTIIWKHIKESEWENLLWELTDDEKLDSFFDGNFDPFIKLVGDDTDIELIKSFLPRFKERFFKFHQEKHLRKKLLMYGDISLPGNSAYKFGKWYEVWHLPIEKEWVSSFCDQDIGSVIRAYVNEAPVSEVPNYLSAIKSCMDYLSKDYYKYLWYTQDNCIYPDIVLCNRCNVQENLVRSLPVHLLLKKLEKSATNDERVFCWNGNHNYCVKEFTVQGVTYAFDVVYHWDIKEPGWQVYLKRRGGQPFTSLQIDNIKEFVTETNENDRLIFKEQFVDTNGYTKDGSLESITNIDKWIRRVQPILMERLFIEEKDNFDEPMQ